METIQVVIDRIRDVIAEQDRQSEINRQENEQIRKLDNLKPKRVHLWHTQPKKN